MIESPSLNHPSPWTESIVEILSVHLHRYMMPMLLDHKLNKIWVFLGFEASHMPPICLKINASSAERDDSLCCPYDQLVGKARQNVCLDADFSFTFGTHTRQVFPILSISEPGREHIHAFALSDDPKLFSKDILTVALRTRINEALRAFRHNSLRIAFEDREDSNEKELIEDILGLIPIWCGADHSASLILASTLEAMVMSHASSAGFQIVSEKLYVQAPNGQPPFDNLGTLAFDVGKEQASLLKHAYEEVQHSKSISLNIFIGDSDENAWFALGENMEQAHRFSTNAHRPKEKLTVLLPLLCQNEVGAKELLGFLSINFLETMPLASLTSRVLETLAAKLGAYLQRSSFFSLSAQQLWLLECVREEQLALSRLYDKGGHNDSEAKLQSFVANANQLIAQSTGLPCVSIAYKHNLPDGTEVLRFVAPQGFTHFGDIDLPIYSDEIEHSSMATLALRLNRPLTLSGGKTHGQSDSFDDHIYVNEKLAQLCDRRLKGKLSDDWRPLKDYYKASRDGSYAAICYPIRSRDEVIGVIAVEVDRDTNWIWWTGFGSYLFYRLLANELAADFSLLGLSSSL